MNNRNAIKLGLADLVVILIVVGFVFTDFQQRSYQAQIKKTQTEQKQLNAQAPDILENAIQKALTSPELEIKDVEVFDPFNCIYTNIYTGRYNQIEDYAKNETTFEDKALFKNICPTQYENLRELYNGEYYWQGDNEYQKKNDEIEFTSFEEGSHPLVEKPRKYLTKYFKAYTQTPVIDKVTKVENDLTIRAHIKDGKKQTDFVFSIDAKNSRINKFTYTHQEEGLSTTTSGTVDLNYTVKEIKPQAFSANQLSITYLIEQIEDLENTITITDKDRSITIDGAAKELTYNAPNQTKEQTCKLKDVDCFAKYRRLRDKLNSYFNDTIEPITLGECTNLRPLTLDQINNPDRMTKIVMQKAKKNFTDWDIKTEVETDTKTGKIIVTKYGTAMNCYQTATLVQQAANFVPSLIETIQ